MQEGFHVVFKNAPILSIQPTIHPLLADILANPLDDGLRLIFADWLEENTQYSATRAEFIRIQVEYARIHPHVGECPLSEKECPTCARAIYLSNLLTSKDSKFRIPSQEPALFAPDCPYRLMALERYHGPRMEWDWYRGFIEEIRLPLVMFNRFASVLFRYHPIQRVRLTDREPYSDGVWRPDGARLHGWLASDSPEHQYHLPERLWSRLTGFNENSSVGFWRLYPTTITAQHALSRACVLWSRQQAADSSLTLLDQKT